MRVRLVLLAAVLLIQPSCVWKLWSKGEPKEDRIYDMYGTVESVTQEHLVIRTNRGTRQFVFVPSSIKGDDFTAGSYVHVYFRKKGEVEEITLVVEKIG